MYYSWIKQNTFFQNKKKKGLCKLHVLKRYSDAKIWILTEKGDHKFVERRWVVFLVKARNCFLFIKELHNNKNILALAWLYDKPTRLKMCKFTVFIFTRKTFYCLLNCDISETCYVNTYISFFLCRVSVGRRKLRSLGNWILFHIENELRW